MSPNLCILLFPQLCLEGVALPCPSQASGKSREVLAARRHLNLYCLIEAMCTGSSRCP